MKRLLSFVLALCMALALLPALSLADAQSEEPMELDFWHWNSDRLPEQVSEVQRLLEEKFNIKINWMPRNSATWSDTITVMLSSGDIPDWWNDLDFVTYDKLVAQGLCAEIPEKTIARVMPRYYEWIQRYLGTEDTLRYHKRDGVNYSLPILWTLGVQGNQPVVREDWLNALGLEIPTTLDELENVLDAFTNNDPDGNGQDDTYGWSASGYNGFSMIFGAFDAYPEAFYERDGAIVNGTIQPGAKDALELLHSWYDAGYLDPE